MPVHRGHCDAEVVGQSTHGQRVDTVSFHDVASDFKDLVSSDRPTFTVDRFTFDSCCCAHRDLLRDKWEVVAGQPVTANFLDWRPPINEVLRGATFT